MLEVLIYLLENYIDKGQEPSTDVDKLTVELKKAGFELREIQRAFRWLDTLTRLQTSAREPELGLSRGLRIYTPEEMNKCDTKARGFLLFLEQSGILSPDYREIVIEKAMQLDTSEVDLEQMKWMVLFVLMQDELDVTDLALLGGLINNSEPQTVH